MKILNNNSEMKQVICYQLELGNNSANVSTGQLSKVKKHEQTLLHVFIALY